MQMDVRLFAALNGFGDDFAEAERIMHRHGWADEYSKMSEKLEPVFVTASWVGGLEALKLLHDCLPESNDEKVQAGIDVVHNILDFMLNKFHERVYPEAKPQVQPLSLESVLKLIDEAFDVPPKG